MVWRILIGIALVIAALLAYASTRPDEYQVVRSIRIAAPAPVVFQQLAEFRRWEAWSPWERVDPDMDRSYEGTPGTVGSRYTWKGNPQVGQGSMTITDMRPPHAIRYRLEFVEPVSSQSDVRFTLEPQGTEVEVTWSMRGTNDLLSKLIGIFMSMERMIGTQFERGLADLKRVSEQEAAA